MASRATDRSLVLCIVALSAGFSGADAKADPLYNVTNLGSGSITFTTASGTTTASSDPTSQLVSVSNGQVSYSFATTPDTVFYVGQGPLYGSLANLNPDPAMYYNPQGAGGLQNENGISALSATLLPSRGEGFNDTVAYVFPLNSDGTLAWSQGGSIMSSPAYAYGQIWIAGINTANQILLGGNYSVTPYNDALVYNYNAGKLTDLDYLPEITAGNYVHLTPIAIDNQGRVLVDATAFTSSGVVSDTLLLTPGGAPDPLATPEPGSCVLWAVITCASYVAVKRAKFIR